MALAYGPEVNFLEPEEETSPSFPSLGKEFKAWQSKSMASVVGPKVNFLEPEQEASPSLPSLGKEFMGLPSKSLALAYGPKLNLLETERKPNGACQVLERNSRPRHPNVWP